MKRVFFGGILGAIVAFIWLTISWSFLPWHQCSFQQFKSPESVRATLMANVEKAGLYTVPGMPDSDDTIYAEAEKGPVMFATIKPQGVKLDFGAMAIYGFIIVLITAWFVAYMTTLFKADCYMGKVWYITVLGFLMAFMSNACLWNWWFFPASYAVVMIVDSVITWFLAGLVIAPFIRKKGCCHGHGGPSEHDHPPHPNS
ncbi:MAG: hypothetical protein MRY21_02030 [Simkaniaceae bacterium]|nr:hypothetical protein [Simkaniaceae bacterium]